MLTGISPLSYAEQQECRQALHSALGGQPGTIIPDNILPAVAEVFAAFFRKRFGYAVGTTATNTKTGQVATRYYDAELKSFRWLVVESPERPDIHAERMDELPAKGEGWTVHERPWKEVVFK